MAAPVAASAEISEETAGISIIPHENAAINATAKISEKHTKQTVALENLEALIINPPKIKYIYVLKYIYILTLSYFIKKVKTNFLFIERFYNYFR